MKNNIIKPSILPGFMELLPNDQEKFNDIVNKIIGVYEKNGCLPIDTPVIEKANVLLAKTGGETEKQVYSFKKGKNDLLLRFDLTVPFARYVAQYFNSLTFPFKRYQIGKVYRGERNQKGRYREFYQCDVDVIAKNKLSIYNDAWVISLVSQAFQAIGLKNYKFQLSNRKILNGLLSDLGIVNSYEVMGLVDKYDKIGSLKFAEELEALIGEEKSEYIIEILNYKGTNEIIKGLESLDVSNDLYRVGLKELKQVIAALELLGVMDNEYSVNLKIVRGLDYYTGTVFETILLNNEQYGSICSGGRYDNLAENYTKNILPGVGISIGITRLFFILKEIGFVDKYQLRANLDYLIIPVGNTIEYCGMVMRHLKEKGYGVNIYFENDSLKKKMNYANRLKIAEVILIGTAEVAGKVVRVKNMESGTEELKSLSDFTSE